MAVLGVGRITKDCIDIWKERTILEVLPDEAKDPKKQKAGRLGQKKRNSAASKWIFNCIKKGNIIALPLRLQSSIVLGKVEGAHAIRYSNIQLMTLLIITTHINLLLYSITIFKINLKHMSVIVLLQG
jgi:hypothetical protein